ncbi:AAA-like domain-containing protein [Haliovirga abyssi]|uniref:AAA family ATPase n=1 Tax=Haliovirga abyssi TaxID=2996794 RepID=A0AAU9D1J0_9FUSO|nr:AAA-like domain-containing protein [Haliovirga abyssi]BDU49834.1 hypothetical protein HLVA_04030 [Haliovirga abyssi]
MKKFNITGTCIPERHYMVNITSKIDRIIKDLISEGDYFTINRPRQYGKTTTMYLLDKKLQKNKEYLLIKVSFEGIGEEFVSEDRFVESFVGLIIKRLKFSNNKKILNYVKNYPKLYKIKQLDEFITDFVLETNKKVVLMIDEVDKSSNNQLFLHFIGMLRDKYLSRNEGEDYTFHTVILAGVHDVKNLRLKLRPDENRTLNSPWNIAVDFDIDMSFNSEEISTMLIEYEADAKTGMDIKNISEKIYMYTNGYPFLVSKLCKVIDEKLDRDFSEKGLEESIKITLGTPNTLFDDIIKNIENNREFYNFIEKVILGNDKVDYVHTNKMVSIGKIYGIIREKNKKVEIDNKIFEILIYNHMIANREIKKGVVLTYEFRTKFIDDDGNLDMELVLDKFQELMKAEYRKIDEKFVEREGRLLFLAFLKPIINGTGFYFVESETRESNRMDIVVTYNMKKFVIELKIWRGGQYEQEGREQLCKYLEAQNLDKGYMIFYNFNKGKEYIKDRVMVNGKEVFEIVV